MLRFYAAGFVAIAQSLSATRMGLAQIEAQRPTIGNFKASLKPSFLDHLTGSARQMQTTLDDMAAALRQAEGASSNSVRSGLDAVCNILDLMDLAFSLAEAERLRARHVAGKYPVAPEDLDSLFGRVRDELETQLFFQLSPGDAKYYEPREPLFGSEFVDKFPSAQFELDEAAKCLAFERPTAAVFHLMRLMESGINAVAECLQIPPPTRPAEKNWGMILRAVKAAMEQRGSAWPNPNDKAFFEAAYVSLDAVKNGWRNPTMHVENKYTSEEAEHIFGSVRAFMKFLGSRMDEVGEPKA